MSIQNVLEFYPNNIMTNEDNLVIDPTSANVTLYKENTFITSFIFYIYGLLNNNYIAIKPFEVKITSINSEIIGDIEELELYAYGDSEIDVIDELREDILDLYNYLINVKDENLGYYPRRWKQILMTQIKKLE